MKSITDVVQLCHGRYDYCCQCCVSITASFMSLLTNVMSDSEVTCQVGVQ